MRLPAVIVLFSLSLSIGAASIDDKVSEAMGSSVRTEAEVARDDNRMPLETLNFFGMQDNMAVLELLPGGGWYTKILAPVLRENGSLALAIGTSRVSERLLGEPGFDRVSVLEQNIELPRNGEFGTRGIDGALDFGNEQFDMVLTFRNMQLNMAVIQPE